ncbi:helix-turn-helix domain-containing protein [Embleya hyalina]|uniref:Transcriptional regulator n=1 Tax=Embleya hyalina TaxID=516124 RepID=A0A401YIM2_9ACTN|nr:Scr1 family TA system antitoxin-like transcriptional regulator [Embleya hyalina]GCD94437.1 transcriptional regulator [Embleya hyalina]
MAEAIDPTQSSANMFATRVTKLRKLRMLTQAQLATLIHVHDTRITQIERRTGSPPTWEQAWRLDAALGADDLLTDLWKASQRELVPDYVREYMDREQAATNLRFYAAQIVPGLLQTRAYARATLRLGQALTSDDQLRDRISRRLDRQARILRGDNPPRIRVILDEAVLARSAGSPFVMRAQMARLLEEANAGTKIQILPFHAGEHAAMGGSLTLVQTVDGSRYAYTESAFDGRLWEGRSEVNAFGLTYEQLRASALSARESEAMIRSVAKGMYRAPHRLANFQLQQPARRGVRGSRYIPRRRPGA